MNRRQVKQEAAARLDPGLARYILRSEVPLCDALTAWRRLVIARYDLDYAECDALWHRHNAIVR